MTKHGVRFKPQQVVSLPRQIEVLNANGKIPEEACRSLSCSVQSYYRWTRVYGAMKADQAKKFKDFEAKMPA